MSAFLKSGSCLRLFAALFCVLLVVNIRATAQRRNPLRSPTGFDDIVFAIALSPDGGTLAIARGAGEPSQRFGRIELWNTASGELQRVIKGFDGPVRSISFSPDGNTLVSGSLEFRSGKIQEKARSRDGSVYGELKWWDSATGELQHKVSLAGEGSSNLQVAYSPDGKDLVITESFTTFSFLSTGPMLQPPTLGSLPTSSFPQRPMVFFDTAMKLLNAVTGELRQKLSVDRPGVITYSPDGSLIAVGVNNEVRLLNSHTGKEVRKLKDFKGRPNDIVFSREGRLLAVAATKFDREASGPYLKIIGRSEVTLFDTRDWKVTRKETDVGAVNTLAFGPGGKLLLIGGVGRGSEREMAGIIVLALETGRTSHLVTGNDYTEAVDSLLVSRDGNLLAMRSGPAAVKVIETRTGKVRFEEDANSVGAELERPVSRFLLSVKRVEALAFSRDGKTLAAETDQGEIKLWDPRTGEVKSQLHNNNDDPTQIAVAADGASFAEISGGKLLVWRAGSAAKLNIPFSGDRPLGAVGISGDGRLLAIGIGNEVRLINEDGKTLKALHSHVGSLAGTAFTDDGRTLASLGDEGRLEIWDLANERVEKTLTVGENILALRFSPNGQTLAAAGEDRSITLWNLQTGQAQAKLEKHEAAVNALAFSPDGRLLASGSDDRTVIIWDLTTGKSKRTLKGHDQTVTAVAFSPDGQTLASGSGNASVVLWEVSSGKFVRVVR